MRGAVAIACWGPYRKPQNGRVVTNTSPDVNLGLKPRHGTRKGYDHAEAQRQLTFLDTELWVSKLEKLSLSVLPPFPGHCR